MVWYVNARKKYILWKGRFEIKTKYIYMSIVVIITFFLGTFVGRNWPLTKIVAPIQSGENEGKNIGKSSMNVDNEKPTKRIEKKEKLLQDVEYNLGRDDFQGAIDIYEKILEEEESDEIETKINDLKEFNSLRESALYDYNIYLPDVTYQLIVHAEDERPLKTVWACAGENDEVYEGNYSYYLREKTQSGFSEYYLGESTFNSTSYPPQIFTFDNSVLFASVTCEASSGNRFQFYHIDDGEIIPTKIDYDGNLYTSMMAYSGMFKVLNTSDNKVQTYDYNWEDGYSASNFTFDEVENVLKHNYSFDLSEDQINNIDKWLDTDFDGYIFE